MDCNHVNNNVIILNKTKSECIRTSSVSEKFNPLLSQRMKAYNLKIPNFEKCCLKFREMIGFNIPFIYPTITIIPNNLGNLSLKYKSRYRV